MKRCVVCAEVGFLRVIYFTRKGPGADAAYGICDRCLPDVLDLGVALCQQRRSISQKPTGPVTYGICDSEPEHVPCQETDAGVTGKGNVGGLAAVEPFTPKNWCAARSVHESIDHEPLEIMPSHPGMSGSVLVLFGMRIVDGYEVQARICKHCGALYAEVMEPEKKPERT